ncbi:MAG: hypothetical protein AMDU1_APLC00021G0022 [Thermoplasmatales archaeon A-plasma]|jgi:molybdopterin molybdotransferase|nr:MAG: hypothetical protein AMDU1_APLC00021G0022 [Thermoplasmatales archaeon A-plasma]
MAGTVRKKMSRFNSMISLDEVSRIVKAYSWKKLSTVEVETATSVGMIAANTVVATKDFPPNPRSLVDGYAIRSAETEGSSPADPSRFKIVGKSEAGKGFYSAVSGGESVEIYTGGILPEGLDAVVMAENATVSGDTITVSSSVKAWENVASRGEDLSAGTVLVSSGNIIKPWHLPALTDGGIDRLTVFSPMRVAVLNTGDELFPDAPDHIENSGMSSMMALLPWRFSNTLWIGQVHDDPDDIARAVKESSDRWDLAIITGGSSLGRKDEVPEAMGIAGAIEVFGGMRTKPGRTTSLYSLDGKPVLSLSGFPSTSILMADLIVEILLEAITGVSGYRIRERLPISSDITTGSGYTRLIPGTLVEMNGRTMVAPASSNRGMRLGSLLNSSGIIIVPEWVEGYHSGDLVEFRLW